MTLEDIDKELASLPADADFDARASLMRRRIELDNAAHAARNAAAGRQLPVGNLVVVVPAGIGISHFFGKNGRIAQSRVADDGRLVLDSLPSTNSEFCSMDRQHGLDWQNANPRSNPCGGLMPKTALDPFFGTNSEPISAARNGKAVTPSDTTDLARVTSKLVVSIGSTGTGITVIFAERRRLGNRHHPAGGGELHS